MTNHETMTSQNLRFTVPIKNVPAMHIHANYTNLRLTTNRQPERYVNAENTQNFLIIEMPIKWRNIRQMQLLLTVLCP